MQKWEYMWKSYEWKGDSQFKEGHYEMRLWDRQLVDQEIWRYIDELGQQGWELLSVVPLTGFDGTNSWTGAFKLWFKRPI